MSLGPAEVMVIVILALLVFGPKKLPEIGRQVGGALREIRKVQSTVKAEIDDAMREPPPTIPPVDEAKASNTEGPSDSAADHTQPDDGPSEESDEPESSH